jgi:hypothetical protein
MNHNNYIYVFFSFPVFHRKLDDFSEAAEEAENAKKSAKIQADEEEEGKKGADYHNKFSDVKALVKAKHLQKEHFDPEPEKVKKVYNPNHLLVFYSNFYYIFRLWLKSMLK